MKPATRESVHHWPHRCALIVGLLFTLAAGGQTADIAPQHCRPGQIAWTVEGMLMGTTNGGVGLVYSWNALLGVRLADGAVLWERPTISRNRRQLCIFGKSRRVFVADTDREARQSLIGMVDSTTGVYLWKRAFPLARENSPSWAINCGDRPSTNNYMELRASSRERMYVSKKDGRTLWENSSRDYVSLFARQDAVISEYTRYPRTVIAQEPRTGRKLWEVKLPSGFGDLFEYNYPLLYGINDFFQDPASIYAFNITSREISWLANGEQYFMYTGMVVLPSSDIYVSRRRTSQLCRLDALTGEDMWCIPFSRRTDLVYLMAGTGDVLHRHADGSKNELRRLDKNTGELVYAADVEERLFDPRQMFAVVPASFYEVPVGRGNETYLTDNGSVTKISKNFTNIWRTSLPPLGSRDGCPERRLNFQTRIRQQVVFDYLGCSMNRTIKLASFNRKTGRIAWLVDENEYGIDPFHQALMYANKNLAIFSTRGAINSEVRAVRTSCRAT